MKLLFILLVFYLVWGGFGRRKRLEDKTKCPNVKAIRNFDLEQVRFRSVFEFFVIRASLDVGQVVCD